jgi:hypothetical protein
MTRVLEVVQVHIVEHQEGVERMPAPALRLLSLSGPDGLKLEGGRRSQDPPGVCRDRPLAGHLDQLGLGRGLAARGLHRMVGAGALVTCQDQRGPAGSDHPCSYRHQPLHGTYRSRWLRIALPAEVHYA